MVGSDTFGWMKGDGFILYILRFCMVLTEAESLLFDGGVAIMRHQNEENMLWKDLLLRNTYLNGQPGPERFDLCVFNERIWTSQISCCG